MTIAATDVKRLRDETDAPMMECKAALQEANGDFESAKRILREKGQAAAAKRADRSTSEGMAFVTVAEDGKSGVGIVLECETDFVAKNESFKALVEKLTSGMLAAGSAGADVMLDGKAVATHIEEAVAVIRENIQLKKAVIMKASSGHVAGYNHVNTGKAASLVEVVGNASNAGEVGKQVAIQVVAFPPTFLKKDDVPKSVIDAEIEVQKQRAINEGKAPDIAEKTAQGRVNKEFFQSAVLLEQPFWMDAKKTVTGYLEEEGKVGGGPISVAAYELFKVGG